MLTHANPQHKHRRVPVAPKQRDHNFVPVILCCRHSGAVHLHRLLALGGGSVVVVIVMIVKASRLMVRPAGSFEA